MSSLQFSNGGVSVLGFVQGTALQVIDSQGTQTADFSEIAADVQTLQTDLTQEIADRESAVSGLDSRLDSAESSVITLQTDLAQEVSDRQTAVSAEQTARQNADSAVDARLSALEATDLSTLADLTAVEGRVDTAESAITSLEGRVGVVEGDISTAETAIQTLNSDIATAQQTITTLESTVAGNLTTAISAEQTARENADNALDARLDTAESSILTLQSGVTGAQASIALNTSSISTLTTDLNSEITARQNADASLQNSVSSISSTVSSQGTRLSSAESAVSSHTTSISTLTTNLNNEITARQTADTATNNSVSSLQSTVSGHTSTLATLQNSIDSEVSNRQTADTALQTAVDSKLPLSGGSLTGNLSLPNHIVVAGDPQDAYTSLRNDGTIQICNGSATMTISATEISVTDGPTSASFTPSQTTQFDTSGAVVSLKNEFTELQVPALTVGGVDVATLGGVGGLSSANNEVVIDPAYSLKYLSNFTYSDQALKATTTGSPVISTAQKKFGSSSLFIPSQSSTSVQFVGGVSITNAFTVEAWVFLSTVSGNDQRFIGWQTSSDNWRLTVQGGNLPWIKWQGTKVADCQASSASVPTGQWVHVAVSYDGNSYRIFQDGVLKLTTASSTKPSATDWASATFNVGNALGDSFGLNSGYVDEVRISKVARYTNTFTPSDVAFVSDSNTVFLHHFEGADNSAVFAQPTTVSVTPKMDHSSGLTVFNTISAYNERIGLTCTSYTSNATAYNFTGLTWTALDSICGNYAFNIGFVNPVGGSSITIPKDGVYSFLAHCRTNPGSNYVMSIAMRRNGSVVCYGQSAGSSGGAPFYLPCSLSGTCFLKEGDSIEFGFMTQLQNNGLGINSTYPAKVELYRIM